jgi:hypothetical protein
MSGTTIEQARMLVRLREMRLTRAQRELAAARDAAERAGAEARAAAEKACEAEAHLAEGRVDLATDLNAADARIALVDRSAFLQSVARSAANDATERRRLCEEAEAERRKAMIVAHARRDRVADQARIIAAGVAAAADERLSIEAEDSRIRV